MLALRYAKHTFSLVTLTAEESFIAIEKAADQGFAGAIIYDVLLMACARKINSTAIYTWNTKHFRRVAPDLAAIIREP